MNTSKFLRIFSTSLALALIFSSTSFADTAATHIVVKNKNLGLSTTKKTLTLQDALTRLHKPVLSYLKPSTSAATLSSQNWTGVVRAVCFSGTAFSTVEYETTVTFIPSDSSGSSGTVTATPSFAGINGNNVSDYCTTPPSGTSSSEYLIDGDTIAVHIPGSSNGFGIWNISIIDGQMIVSQGGSGWSWRLKRQAD